MATVTGHDDVRELTLKLLALAQRMEERDARAMALLAQQASALQAAAHGLESEGSRLAADVARALRDQGREAVQAGVGEAATAVRERLAQVAADAARAGGALQASAEAVRRQRTLWSWAAPIALVTGSLLAVGAAAYAVAAAREEVGRARIEVALLRAYNEADVTLCDGRLCANVDERAPSRGRYRPVAPRGARGNDRGR